MDREGAGHGGGGAPQRRLSYKAEPFFEKQGFAPSGSQDFDRLRLVETLRRRFRRAGKTNLVQPGKRV